jgi:hypothetical protein
MPNTYSVDTKQIEEAFTHHPPKENQPGRYELLRSEAKQISYLISNYCPDGRYKSLALTAIEQAIMWANKAISHEE